MKQTLRDWKTYAIIALVVWCGVLTVRKDERTKDADEAEVVAECTKKSVGSGRLFRVLGEDERKLFDKRRERQKQLDEERKRIWDKERSDRHEMFRREKAEKPDSYAKTVGIHAKFLKEKESIAPLTFTNELNGLEYYGGREFSEDVKNALEKMK